MAESVNPAQLVVRGFREISEDDAGGADGAGNFAGFDDAVADRAGGLITGTCDNGRVGGKSGGGGSGGCDFASDLVRLEGFRQDRV